MSNCKLLLLVVVLLLLVVSVAAAAAVVGDVAVRVSAVFMLLVVI